jgi:Ribbon-helix-helix protein, copG family
MLKSASHAKASCNRPLPAAEVRAKRTVVTFTVDPDLLRQFDAEAKREDRSRSGMLVALMRRLVEGRQQ